MGGCEHMVCSPPPSMASHWMIEAAVAEGVRGGQQETLSLSPLTGSPLVNEGDESDLEIAFDRYQRVQGLLAIPEGFEPHTITLNVQEGNVVRASRSVKPGL